jgi:hypothetical protein
MLNRPPNVKEARIASRLPGGRRPLTVSVVPHSPFRIPHWLMAVLSGAVPLKNGGCGAVEKTSLWPFDANRAETCLL